MTEVYISLQADINTALNKLHETLSRHQDDNLDAALIVTGDLNKVFLKKVMSNFYQHYMQYHRGEDT